MKEIYVFYLFLLLVLLFAVIRLFMVKFLRQASNTEGKVKVSLGKLEDLSAWGNAAINGVRVNKGIRIAKYEKGYLLKFKMLYGGSELWLPKESINITSLKERRFLIPAMKEIESGENKVILYGKLAGKIV